MPAYVTIGDPTGKVVPCNRCGVPFQPLFEQYMVCGCQDWIIEAVSSTQGVVITVPMPFRNTVIAHATLARACQELQRYIPPSAGVSPV